MINSISQTPFYTVNSYPKQQKQSVDKLALQLGQKTELNPQDKNHAQFNQPLVNEIVSYREYALPALANILNTSKDEKQICETLYTLDKMIENNVKGVKHLYPHMSRFNNTDSPNIQVYLAGLYRKMLLPDSFGPLVKMLVRDSINPPQAKFDPTEEIGGAILDYLRAKGAVHFYSQNN